MPSCGLGGLPSEVYRKGLKAGHLSPRDPCAQATTAADIARSTHEIWRMATEDVAGHHWNLTLELMSANERSREALAFSFRSVQQMENRDAEDWTQVVGSAICEERKFSVCIMCRAK